MKRLSLFLLVIVVISLSAGCSDREGQAAEARELVRGTWDGNVFTSEFASLTFTMPDNWVSGSDEEIAALMGVSVEFLSDQGMKITERMLELSTIYDMAAQNPVNGDSILLMYENLTMHIGGTRLTEMLYLESLAEQLDSFEMGYTFLGIKDTTIAGQIYKTLEASIDIYGLTQYYHARKIDNFMCAIIVTIDQGNDNMISNLSGL